MKTARQQAIEICREIGKYGGGVKGITKEEFFSIEDAIDSGYNDFCASIAGAEYRIIDDDAIEEIHENEIRDTVGDIYFSGREIPWWVEIDLPATAKNVSDSDGYGHHFSSYDGSELGVGRWHIFRIG